MLHHCKSRKCCFFGSLWSVHYVWTGMQLRKGKVHPSEEVEMPQGLVAGKVGFFSMRGQHAS